MQSLPLLGTTVAEKYRIERLLGEGGMGAVFQAHHELIDKRVALKWLHPAHSREDESQRRLLREARASARIHHPNVVEVYDVGMHEGTFFIVMELLEGESFEDLLRRGGVSVAEALRILLGAMHGAAEAHRCGIIHRDLKLENIFVVRSAGGRGHTTAKVLDFGVSKLVEDRQPSALVTQTGHTLGTPMYMSAEQMHAVRDIDHRTDIYSLGICLYRALTGTFPYAGETFAAVAVEMATRRPKAPRQLHPALPSALDRIVLKAMAYDRASRYASLHELIDALTQVLSSHGALASVSCRVADTKEQVARAGTAVPASGQSATFQVPLRASTGGATWQTREDARPSAWRRRWLPIALSIGLGLAGALLARGMGERPAKSPQGELTGAATATPKRASSEEPPTQRPAARAPANAARPTPLLPSAAASPLVVSTEPHASSGEAPPSVTDGADVAHAPGVTPRAEANAAPAQPGADASVAKPAPSPAATPMAPKREAARPSRTATGRRSGTLRLEELTQ